MLVLSRRVGQRVYIGPNICITVTYIAPGKVRIGVEAPRDLAICREEIAPPDHPMHPENRGKDVPKQ